MGTEGTDVVARHREEVQQRRNLGLRNLTVGSKALGEMKGSHCPPVKVKMAKRALAMGACTGETNH